MNRFFLLALTTWFLSPISTKAEISKEIHKRCLDPRDYSGCVRTNQSSILKFKKEMTGIGVTLFLNTETAEITIQSIINGSPASNADIESGDVILEVDGMSMKGLGIEEAIEFINEYQIELHKDVVLDENTRLIGTFSVFDSLELVQFIVDVESLLDDEFDIEIELTSEKAMSRRNSPFISVNTLVNFIVDES